MMKPNYTFDKDKLFLVPFLKPSLFNMPILFTKKIDLEKFLKIFKWKRYQKH